MRENLALLLKPIITRMPGQIQKYDDPFLPFGKAVIAATHDLVGAYVFDCAAYLSIGAAGAIALERTIAFAHGDALTVLHGPFATADYAALLDGFEVDAITVLGRFAVPPERMVLPVNPVDDVKAGYWPQAGRLNILGQSMTVAGEDVLYASKDEDFTDHIRARLKDLS